MTHALVLGKFWPLHVGHSHLIEEAQRRADRVTVQLLVHPSEDVPLEVRRAWIAEKHPDVHLVTDVDEAPVDFEDPSIWDQHMAVIESLLDAPVDVVATSDEYGAELARRLGATWLRVDPGRALNPISGTAVRRDPGQYWGQLSASVRAWYARRIVVTGAESTGSTTLAAALADRLETIWVPEYGRQWSIERPGGLSAPWQTDEFVKIATLQTESEDAAARMAPNPWVVCDTDAIATALWHERYIGFRSATVDTLADNSVHGRSAFAGGWPALVVLTGDEIDFVDDGVRDGQDIRHDMQEWFRTELDARGLPWIEVHGSVSERIDQVLTVLR